jgi:hypothetical protein
MQQRARRGGGEGQQQGEGVRGRVGTGSSSSGDGGGGGGAHMSMGATPPQLGEGWWSGERRLRGCKGAVNVESPPVPDPPLPSLLESAAAACVLWLRQCLLARCGRSAGAVGVGGEAGVLGWGGAGAAVQPCSRQRQPLPLLKPQQHSTQPLEAGRAHGRRRGRGLRGEGGRGGCQSAAWHPWRLSGAALGPP